MPIYFAVDGHHFSLTIILRLGTIKYSNPFLLYLTIKQDMQNIEKPRQIATLFLMFNIIVSL